MRNRIILGALIAALFSLSTQAQTTTFNGVIKDLSSTPIPTGQVGFTLKPGIDTTISGQARFTSGTIFCEIHNPAVVSTSGTGTITVVVNPTQNWQVGDSLIFAGTADATLNASSVASPYVITGGSGTTYTFTQAGTHTNGAGGTVGGLYASGGTGGCKVTQNTALTPANTYYSIGLWPMFSLIGSFNTYAIGSGPVDISTIVPTPGQMPAYSFVDAFSNQTITGIKNFNNPSNAFAGTFTGSLLGTANNALTLLGTTWAAPGPIGGTTPGSGTFTSLSVTSANNVILADTQAGADACAKINAAAVLLPAAGGVIDARGFQGGQTCSTNPFAGVTTKQIYLLLGTATFTTTAMWTLENAQTIVGSGRASTIIKADPTFNFGTSKAVVRIGSTAFTAGARVENLDINCNSVSAGVGLYSAWADEQSGPVHILIQNCAAEGAWWETNAAANSFWQDVEIIPGSAGVTTTIPALINDVKGFRGANGLSVNTIGFTSKPSVCIRLDNATMGLYSGLHAESCTIGLDLGFSTGLSGVIVSSLYCQATVTDCVKINGPDTPKNSLVLMGINPVGATNTINDVENSKVITGGLIQDFYAAGPNPFIFVGAPLASPQLSGVTNGTGLQLFNTSTTCTTGASVGAICTTGAITLPVAYADTNYRLSCTGQGVTAVPIVETYTKSNTTFTITIAALTAVAASFSSYDCSAVHN